jgi:outer membrane protein assembly factor BamB
MRGRNPRMSTVRISGLRDKPPVRSHRIAAVLLAGAVGCSVVIGTSPTTLAAGALSMTGFKPTSGPVGTVVTISGTGFVSGDIVAFSGTVAAASTANSSGTKLKASVPAFAASGPITVTDPLTGQTVGLPGTTFRVSTGLFASPNRVWPGGNFTLSGSALTPDRSEPIYIGQLRVGEAQTNAQGNFSVGVAVPWNLPAGKTTTSVRDTLRRIGVVFYLIGSWPAFQHDPAHTGVEPYEPTLSPSTVSGLSERWGNTTVLAAGASPAVADGIVYIGSQNNSAEYAVNAATGVVEWSYTTGGMPENLPAPAVANGVLYFGSGDGYLYALTASTGALRWSYSTGWSWEAAPEVANGIVYADSMDNSVYALDASTGALKWSYTTGGPITSSPAVANGIVYADSMDGNLYALNATTGALDWSYAIGKFNVEQFGAPTVANGSVYVGSANAVVYALNASTGAFEWSYTTGFAIYSTPALANGVLYIGSADHTLYALNGSTGALDWSYTTGNAILQSAAVANGVVYIGSIDHKVYALRASDGTPLWSSATAQEVDSSPAVADGMVYITSIDGILHAYGLV